MKSSKEAEQTKPRQAVVMLIYNERGEVLFTKRSSTRKLLPGVWALPSGHIESGENLKGAAIREAGEELNIQVTDVNLVETINEPSGDNALVYLVNIPKEAYNGTPSINNDEFESISWMRIENFYSRFSDEEIGSTLRHLRARFQITS